MEEQQENRIAALFDNYRRLLFFIASKQIPNPADCEEIVQETFVRAIEKIDLLETLTENQQLAYLSRITENLAYDHLRRKQTGKDISLTEDEWLRLPGVAASLDETLQSMESADLVRYMLTRLSPTDRILITGKYLLGYSVKELSRQLNCSSRTLSVRLHRAKARAISLWKEIEHGQKTT